MSSISYSVNYDDYNLWLLLPISFLLWYTTPFSIPVHTNANIILKCMHLLLWNWYLTKRQLILHLGVLIWNNHGIRISREFIHTSALQWRHNEGDGVSDHQHHDCLLNRIFRRRSEKTSKLRVTGLCAGNSHVTGEFPAQRASNVENVSIWWHHHDNKECHYHVPSHRMVDWHASIFVKATRKYTI